MHIADRSRHEVGLVTRVHTVVTREPERGEALPMWNHRVRGAFAVVGLMVVLTACGSGAGAVRDYVPEEVRRGGGADDGYTARAVDAAMRTEVVAALVREGHEFEVEWVVMDSERERGASDHNRRAYPAQLELSVYPPARSSAEELRRECPAVPDDGTAESLLLHGAVVADGEPKKDTAWLFLVYGDKWRASCGSEGELLPPEGEGDVREPEDPES